MLKENLKEVQENILKACEKSGRNPEDVTLIAVSKTKPVPMLQEIYDENIRDFGENKVQELVEKYDELPQDIKWHMIGHLQRNKVKYIVDKVCLIHSVDSYRLAEEINIQAKKKNITVPILVEAHHIFLPAPIPPIIQRQMAVLRPRTGAVPISIKPVNPNYRMDLHWWAVRQEPPGTQDSVLCYLRIMPVDNR
jgi:hypothetical protein